MFGSKFNVGSSVPVVPIVPAFQTFKTLNRQISRGAVTLVMRPMA